MILRYIKTALLFILLSCFCVNAEEGVKAQIFQIPRYEAEQIISDWLVRQGFKVRMEQDSEKVILIADNTSKHLNIVLRHHSPLAVEVYAEDGPEGFSDDLNKFLSEYQKGSFSLNGTIKGGSKEGGMSLLLRKLNESVVCIRASVKDTPIQVSGFVVDTEGLILCTAHTLKSPSDITVITSSGRALKGRIVRIDFKKDLALIDCDCTFNKSIPINNKASAIGKNKRIVSIGCPRNNPGTVTNGVLMGPPRLMEGQVFLQANILIEPGSSGSPVFDDLGNLIGVVQGRMKMDHSNGLIIPLNTIISFIREK